MFKYLQYAIIAIVAIILAPQVWSEYKDKENSKTWPVATGSLLRAHVKEISSSTTTSGGWTRRERHFELIVDYSYEVDGRSYVGHRIRPGGKQYSTEAGASEDMALFQSTNRLAVFYDPKKPESSVLERL